MRTVCYRSYIHKYRDYRYMLYQKYGYMILSDNVQSYISKNDENTKIFSVCTFTINAHASHTSENSKISCSVKQLFADRVIQNASKMLLNLFVFISARVFFLSSFSTLSIPSGSTYLEFKISNSVKL